MAKISVIIPVYGVEKYLNRCVESVVNDTEYRDNEGKGVAYALLYSFSRWQDCIEP